MQLCKYYPVANDRMGTIWTLASIKGACVIEFGPAGTTHYAIEGIGSLNGHHEANIYSTHMDQSDVTFGKYDRLEQAIIEVDENIKPKYIFVMASSISSIIGADVESVCFELASKVKAKLIPITTGGLKHHYHIGVEQTLLLLVKNIVKPADKDPMKYNILGFTMDRYNYLSDVEELKRMMSVLFNKEVQTIFTCNTTIEEIEQASSASLNIVIRREALKAAQYLEKTYGIPYIYHSLHGLENTMNFIQSITNIEGYELNQEKYEEEISKIKEQLFTVKRKFFFYKETKKCAVFGDYDTAVGMKQLLEELGLEVNRAEILYQTEVEEPLVAGGTEFDRMKYLKQESLLLLLGDGATIEMDYTAKSSHQVSNPNLHHIMIYPYTPFIGFRGMLYWIEKILNISL